MNLKFFFTALILLVSSLYSVAQTKNEREERTDISNFPEIAQDVIKALPKKCKRIKLYKETDGDKKSYEAKFKYNKQYYSLEFSENGTIEDIEITTKFKNLEETIKTNLKTYFKNSFTKYKIIKIQKQFVYSLDIKASEFIINILSQNANSKPNFEIIAEVKTEKTRNIREFTFNNSASFLSSRVLNPTSYEHVLY